MAKQTQEDRAIQAINAARQDGLISPSEAQRLRGIVRDNSNNRGNVANSANQYVNQQLSRRTGGGGGSGGGGDTGGGSGGGGGDDDANPCPGAAWIYDPKTKACTRPPFPGGPGRWMWDDDRGWIPEPKQPDEEEKDGAETERERRNREAEEARNRQSAEAYLTDLLSQYGLQDLIGTVSGLIKEWGTNTNIIVSRLRQTDAYKTRFKGNEQRIKNGYSAMSEAEYLSTEDAIKSTMRKYGLTSDYYSRDKLANLIGGDVSATEVDGRIGQAKKVIDNADPNIKNSLVGLYGVGMSDMLGYVLAPETALEVVQRRVNAGFATGVARGQGIDLGSTGDTSLAEQIGDLTFGDERTLRSQFDAIGGLARSTRRLSGIDQERITDRDVVKGEFGIDSQAGQRVKKMQSRERARFSGQSATTSSTLSGGGI